MPILFISVLGILSLITGYYTHVRLLLAVFLGVAYIIATAFVAINIKKEYKETLIESK